VDHALEEIETFVTGLDVGMTFVNELVASEPGVPFGGTKRSGVGRELGSAGLYELVNAKTVIIGAPGLGAATREPPRPDESLKEEAWGDTVAALA
jgi:hypothetical protein